MHLASILFFNFCDIAQPGGHPYIYSAKFWQHSKYESKKNLKDPSMIVGNCCDCG